MIGKGITPENNHSVKLQRSDKKLRVSARAIKPIRRSDSSALARHKSKLKDHEHGANALGLLVFLPIFSGTKLYRLMIEAMHIAKNSPKVFFYTPVI